MENELELIRNIGKEGVWLNKNYKEIQRNFGNKFVAVSKEHIVATGENFDKVLKKVIDQKINPVSVVIEFIPESGTILIL